MLKLKCTSETCGILCKYRILINKYSKDLYLFYLKNNKAITHIHIAQEILILVFENFGTLPNIWLKVFERMFDSMSKKLLHDFWKIRKKVKNFHQQLGFNKFTEKC